MTRPFRTFVLAVFLALPLAGQSPAPPADNWLAPSGIFPGGFPLSLVQSNFFHTLHAEVVAEKIKVVWLADNTTATTQVTLQASVGAPGHWPARDWHSHPMTQRDGQWDAVLPVEDIDEPTIYFVQMVGPGRTNLSPMRAVVPRQAGLENPSRPFWPFLEGFEEGVERWRWFSNEEASSPLRTAAPGRSGRNALAIALPQGKGSVTVATTCVRGWQLQLRGATGVRLWLRAREGAGRVRFALLANAFTPNQATGVWPKSIEVNDRWQNVDLYFSEVGAFRLGAVDLFTTEFIADKPGELLLDDMQLLGPWRPEP